MDNGANTERKVDLSVGGQFAAKARLKEQHNWEICKRALEASRYIREYHYMVGDQDMPTTSNESSWAKRHFEIIMLLATLVELAMLARIAWRS